MFRPAHRIRDFYRPETHSSSYWNRMPDRIIAIPMPGLTTKSALSMIRMGFNLQDEYMGESSRIMLL